MTVLTFYDAAYPLSNPPATDGVAFYIGGNATHVWTDAEIAGQHARYRLPVFVRDNPSAATPSADVTAAVARLKAIGAPHGCLVAWDVETSADSSYIAAVYADLKDAGYKLIVYGSESSVFGNANPDGLYWGAQWTGKEHLAGHDAMTQWVSFSAYDESVALSSLPFWDTKAGKIPEPPSPVPVKSAPVTWEEAMAALPTVRATMSGEVVRTIQGLCCARGHSTAIDGNFGPQTTLAVDGVQQSAKISADGIVGPETWAVLLGIK